MYRVPVVDYRIKGVLTNTMATGAYRGAGRPEGNYLIERLIEKAAREMSIDRGRAAPAQPAYARGAAVPHACGRDLRQSATSRACWIRRLRAARLGRLRRKRKKNRRRRGKLRGRGRRGLPGMDRRVPTETVDIEVDADGTVTVFSGTQAMGQGLETTLHAARHGGASALIPDKVTIVQGDTDRANGVGSVGSRSAFVGGSAVVAAGRKMIAARQGARGRGARGGGRATSNFATGALRIAGTDRAHRAAELAARQPQRVHPRLGDRDALHAVVAERRAGGEVEIDPETGEVTLARADQLRRHRPHHQPHDRRRPDPRRHRAGRRPGALGAGALRRRTAASSLSGSLMDYCVPRADQLPPMRARFDESVPCKTNLLGVKGCGELGTIGAVPAVVHAVLDALRPACRTSRCR